MTMFRYDHIPGVIEIVKEAEDKLHNATGYNLRIAIISKDNELVASLAHLCCEIWNIELAELKKLSRKQEHVVMRYILGWLLYKETDYSQQEVAEYLGYKDRVSILNVAYEIQAFVFTKDPLFYQYYKPVKHLFSEQNKV